jgi:hypothetical protein
MYKSILRSIVIYLLISTAMACTTGNSKKEDNVSGDTSKILLIDQVLNKKEKSFNDYDTIFSGSDPIVFIVLNDFITSPDAENSLKLLALEKLYREAEALSNAIPKFKEDNKDIDKFLNWPISKSGTVTYNKWREGVKKAQGVSKL